MNIRKNSGKNSITLIMVLAVFALFLRLAIEQVINSNISQNESSASLALKSISAALENYAKEHLGNFPDKLAELSQSTPPYLDRDYLIGSPIKGYNFSCNRLDVNGYSCFASPVRCNISGKAIFTITTGGVILTEDCGKNSKTLNEL